MLILGEINRGGFGRVEKVRLDDGTVAARKVFDPTAEVLRVADEAKLKKRFQREVRVQSVLRSEFVIPVLATDLTSNTPSFVMPLADGNFSAELEAARVRGETPTKALADILNALESLHTLGYVHRDLKPANVLLHEGRWKLSDFGLVLPKSGTTTTLTSTFSAWGTVDYCAPEQAQDFRSATPAVDIYAFGCILHDIVVGTPRVPYRRQTAAGPIGFIIEKCTEENPKRRFRTVASLRGALLSQLSRHSGVATSSTAKEWADRLGECASWDPQTFEQFARFVQRAQEDGAGLWDIFDRTDEELITAMHSKDAETWAIVALTYCDWAHSSFGFAYCDVVVRRLEALFQLGDLQIKAAAAMAAAVLGVSHNRWFVMGRLMEMCGLGLDEHAAERIAIEIEVEEAHEMFSESARRIGVDLTQFHPRIAERLDTPSA